jgi:glycosyltransferase involved in cell wall biosynthesis
MTALVTIGIPVYNGARYLEQALDAALAQTYPNLEIIVSDNCSTDRTEEICSAYAARDSRIRYVRQARNLGWIGNYEYLVGEARGDYFCWLASDDGMDPAYAATLAGHLDRHPDWAAVGSDVQVIDEADRQVRVETIPSIRAARVARDWPAVRREYWRYYVDRRFLLAYGLFRSSVLKEVSVTAFGSLREQAGVEIPLLAQVALRGKTVSIPEVLKTYRVHGESTYVALDRSGPLWRLRNYRNIWFCLWTVAGRGPSGLLGKIRARAYLLASFPVYVARLSGRALIERERNDSL